MLHPFRRQIEQLNSPLLEILHHAALFQTAETGVKRRYGNLPLPHGRHLILHQRDERRNHQRQPWQKGRRQLIAERLPLPRRHDRHRIAPRQHGANDGFLARPERRKPEPFVELSSQIIHWEAESERKHADHTRLHTNRLYDNSHTQIGRWNRGGLLICALVLVPEQSLKLLLQISRPTILL